MRKQSPTPRHLRLSRLSALLVLMLSLLLLMNPLGGMRTSAQRIATSGALQNKSLQQDAPAAQLNEQQLSAPEFKMLSLPQEILNTRNGSATDSAAQATALGNGGSVNAVLREYESNDTVATAQPIGNTGVRVRGDLYQFPVPVTGDVDVYSFYANAGDRVYAAVATSFTGGNGNSVLDILSTDGTTVIETDEDDGEYTPLSSVVAGATLPVTGTYYARVRPFNLTQAGTIRPYDFYLKVQSGAPGSEVEPNNNLTSALPASGWVSGAISTNGDQDIFAFTANAGDTIAVMLDADPERDGPTVPFWNPQAYIGLFNGSRLLGVDDTSSNSATDPPAEANFMTVKSTGTYYVLVQSGTSGAFDATFTYHLSVSLIPANQRRCTSYAGTGGAIADLATTDFTLNVPDNVVINNLQVSMSVTDAVVADLDVSLLDPEGDEVVLFDDMSDTTGAGTPQINFVIDDEAAIPAGLHAVHRDMRYSPEAFSRLSWFKGQQSNGTWKLRFRDDTSTNTGTLNSWSINFCEEPGVRRPFVSEIDVFSADFESGTNGFTHSGTADEWARGTPSGGSTPITGCFSGSNCWKTDLTGTYDSSSNQDLLSPAIDLTNIAGRNITLSWWQKYQLDSASNDTAFVEIREVGNTSNFRKLWEWKDADMVRSVGNPSTSVQEAAGWSLMEYDISEFGGKQVEVRFHLESNATATNRSGIAIDDFDVSYDATAARADFDNDAQSDVSVWRQDTGGWYIRNSSTAAITFINNWGQGALGDIAVPGNYGGTQLTDIAVWREPEGNWYILPDPTISTSPFLVGWGMNNDVPVPGDYDGDTLTDYAVWRGSEGNWYIRYNAGGSAVRNWGLSSDTPVPADYDGDGKTDIAVFRPSEGAWYIIDSFTGFGRVVSFGQSGDKLVPADYDGDRKADIAVWRGSEGNWYILRSSDNRQTVRSWGISTDIPVPGKYDADAKYDIAVWRPSEGNWYIIRSSDGAGAMFNLGLGTDVPVPSAYLPQ